MIVNTRFYSILLAILIILGHLQSTVLIDNHTLLSEKDFVKADTAISDPCFNVTYGTTIGDISPEHPNAPEGVIDWCSGMAIGDDGSIYVTGNTRYFKVDPVGLYFSHQFLIKYNPSSELLWVVWNDDGTQVRSIRYHSGHIYTTGYFEENMVVTKWSSQGEKVWERMWSNGLSQCGVAIAVQEDGSIYVISSAVDFSQAPDYSMNSSILKYSPVGTLMWERSLPELELAVNDPGELYIQGEYLYFHRYSEGVILNLEGSYITRFDCHSLIPDGENGFFSAFFNYQEDIVELVHFNEVGDSIWTESISKQLVPDENWYVYLECMAITPNNTLQLLMYHQTEDSSHNIYDYEFLLLTYDYEGNQLDNCTIFSETIIAYYRNFYMSYDLQGHAYFTFDVNNDDGDVMVYGYQLYEVEPVVVPSPPMEIVVVLIIVIVVVLAGIAVKYRSVLSITKHV